MRRMLITAILTLAFLYVGLCGVLFVFQRSFIYFPQPSSHPDGSTRPHDGPNALIYFGGNAEDVSLNMPAFSRAFPDRAIYLLHYRGFGGSPGSPSESALFADALSLFDQVHTKHRNITVIGRSLGSGIAVYVASLRDASRLVLITPFDSLQDVAASHFPYLPVGWLLRDKYQSWKYAPNVKAPTTIVAAELDEIIPRTSTERLRTRFNARLSYVVIAGATHNTISKSADYLPLLIAASTIQSR